MWRRLTKFEQGILQAKSHHGMSGNQHYETFSTCVTKTHVEECSNPPMSKYETTTKLPYEKLIKNLDAAKTYLKRPINLAEKILFSHLENPNDSISSNSYLRLKPDRVAMPDGTALMALLQFQSSGLNKVSVPTTIFCDHLIPTTSGESENESNVDDIATKDLKKALNANEEVYTFLQGAASQYNIGFWKPGSGISHQLLLENYVFPGILMLGTDSHTPNGGGLGGICIGVGGGDAVDVMVGLPWELPRPKVIQIALHGKLSGWTSPKDIILKVANELSTKGGTGCILEYTGNGLNSLSCTGMATISNMGTEVGATCSIFPYSESMYNYLCATDRKLIATEAKRYHQILLNPDKDAQYYRTIHIDLDSLKPQLNGPFTPDLSHNLDDIGKTALEKNWPTKISAALIGSCTNSSYEDLYRAASIAKQAVERNLKAKTSFYITPGSERIRQTIERDGISEIFRKFGGQILANACGPCLGQWNRTELKPSEPNTILTSYNRNFSGRNDGNAATHAFLSSPEVVTAYAIHGTLSLDPTEDSIFSDGEKLNEPSSDLSLPPNGFVNDDSGYIYPGSGNQEVLVDPSSSRLQILQPFKPWTNQDFINLSMLIKVKGKCTTDHISPAGPWLKYRGHLGNISNSLLIGATNAQNGKVNCVYNKFNGNFEPVPEVARFYQKMSQGWIIVGDENYGEGSSRETAALIPRYLGCRAVIGKSFARIHEMNLKRQGILPLTFSNASDYENLNGENTSISFVNILDEIQESEPIFAYISPDNDNESNSYKIQLNHTMNGLQINWFRAGSALNYAKLLMMSVELESSTNI